MNSSSDDLQAKPPHSGLPSQIINIFVAPKLALDYASNHRHSWWAPFGITVLLAIAVGVWFSLGVNLESWRETMIQMATARAPQDAAKIASIISQRGRGYLLTMYAGVAFIGFTLTELIYALYLHLADKVLATSKRTYSEWFNFTAWVWLPKSLGYIAILITFAISPKNLAPTELDITSLNALFFHFNGSSRFFGVAHFSILYFWVIWLTAFGVQRWIGHNTVKATLVAIAPFLVVYALVFFL